MNVSENTLYAESPTPENKVWMLGFFDVLGFSARVETESVDKVYDDYQRLIKNVLDKPAIETGGMHVPTFTGGSIVSMGGKLDVSFTYFSDTILLWAPVLPMFPQLFMQRCADLMCEALLMGIPLRGAISVGEGYMHKGAGIYLGQHIVDAAQLENAQEQIGVGLTASAAYSALIPSAHPTQFIEYNVPIKQHPNGGSLLIVLDWPRRWRDCNHGDLIQCLQKLRPDNESAVKYDNTIKFVEWSEAHNDWHKHQDKAQDFQLLKYRPVRDIINDNPQLFPEQWRQMKAHVRAVHTLTPEEMESLKL